MSDVGPVFVMCLALFAVGRWLFTDKEKKREKALQKLKEAPIGTQKIVTVAVGPRLAPFAHDLSPDELTARYSEAGWTVRDQSSSKSFGSPTQITIRFRKDT
ncbi:MAG: hypothetical protein ACYCOU_19525 [Sulfobacillus sp.]